MRGCALKRGHKATVPVGTMLTHSSEPWRRWQITAGLALFLPCTRSPADPDRLAMAKGDRVDSPTWWRLGQRQVGPHACMTSNAGSPDLSWRAVSNGDGGLEGRSGVTHNVTLASESMSLIHGRQHWPATKRAIQVAGAYSSRKSAGNASARGTPLQPSLW